MDFKLKILEDFLHKKGFLREANLCSDLRKISIPMMIDRPGLLPGRAEPVDGSEEKINLDIKNKHLKNEHGWVYILRTEPTNEGAAPYSWYVGESTDPATRYIEHKYSHSPWRWKPGDMPSRDPRDNRPDDSPLYDIRSPRFTSKHRPLEMVSLELIPYDPGANDRDARKKREKDIFLRLAKFVGSANIGGDSHLVKIIKSKPDIYPAHNPGLVGLRAGEYEGLVKSYIGGSHFEGQEPLLMNGDSANALASALNEVTWEDVTDRDISKAVSRHEYFSGLARKKLEKAKDRAQEMLANMSPEDREKLKGRMLFVMERTSISDAMAQKLGMKKIDFFAITKALDISYRKYESSISKEDLVKALNWSWTDTEAAQKLGVAQSTVMTRCERYDVIQDDELGVKAREKRKEDIREALKCSHNIAEAAKRLFPDKTYNASNSELQRNLNHGTSIRNLGLRGWERKYPEGLLRHPECYRKPPPSLIASDEEVQNVINVLRESRTIQDAYAALGMKSSTFSTFAKVNNINQKAEVGLIWKEQHKQEVINALNNSSSRKEVALLFDPPLPAHKVGYYIRRYEIDEASELGKNLNESID